jgi:predicted AlkP superfamily pyrophosphatase or phosphodiesterase
MDKRVCLPDYKNTNINVVSSIVSSAGLLNAIPTNKIVDEYLNNDYTTIYFFILDGLGYHYLQSKDSFLKEHCKSKMSAVFPPTTACATTSIHTCSYPEDHGWLGWSLYFEEENREIELFINRDKYSKEYFKKPFFTDVYLPTKNIYERMDEVGYLNYTFYPAFIQSKQSGENALVFDELDDLLPQLKELNQNKEKKFVSIYYPLPDGLMHRHGTDHELVETSFYEIDTFMKKLSQEDGALIIATADHGLCDSKQILLNHYPDITKCLKREISNDPRFVNFFIKDGMEDEFVKNFNKYFNEDFLLLSKIEVLDLGLFGPNKKMNHMKFIGDYVAIAIGHYVLEQYRNDPSDTHNFKAEHSGLTKDEMEIPLIIIETGCVK